MQQRTLVYLRDPPSRGPPCRSKYSNSMSVGPDAYPSNLSTRLPTYPPTYPMLAVHGRVAGLLIHRKHWSHHSHFRASHSAGRKGIKLAAVIKQDMKSRLELSNLPTSTNYSGYKLFSRPKQILAAGAVKDWANDKHMAYGEQWQAYVGTDVS